MPQISVIVPVYKAEAYLKDCVDSILSQTFSDFELILVNDGSPDGSGGICDAYAAGEPRVSVIHQTNQGQAAARNHALVNARGQWICFVDSDDVIHPQMLELLYTAASESGAGISMCRYVEAPSCPETFFQVKDGTWDVLTMEENTMVQLYDADAYPAWVACTKLVRKDLVESYPFREGRVFEDNEAVCRWVCAAGRLARIDHELYYYRTNQGSTTKSVFSLKKLDYLWALDSITRFYGKLGWHQMQRRFFDRYADAAVSACMGLRYELDRKDLIPGVAKDLRVLAKQENLKLTTEQKEALLEAEHPEWMGIYWPLAGAARTVREEGISGIARKIKKKFAKEDGR